MIYLWCVGRYTIFGFHGKRNLDADVNYDWPIVERLQIVGQFMFYIFIIYFLILCESVQLMDDVSMVHSYSRILYVSVGLPLSCHFYNNNYEIACFCRRVCVCAFFFSLQNASFLISYFYD